MVVRFPVSCFFVVSLVFANVSPALLGAADDSVRFDVPAIVPARTMFGKNSNLTTSEKLIEVVIPVSAQIDSNLRGAIHEFRFDIFWNRSAVAVVDYGPKTVTFSHIDGLISIEKHNDRNSTLGLNLKSSYQDMVAATAQAQLTNKHGTTYRYSEIPQHDLLVASGTIKRGTGAFFRFHPSKKDSLEGGRDLVVAYRVPSNWRGGILQIECRAEGQKKLIGPWGDEIKIGKSFVMPVYLEGDDQAREIATEFAKSQQSLNSSWQRHLDRHAGSGFKHEIESLFGGAATGGVPAEWTQYLIQTGEDRHYDLYFRQLSQPVRLAATEFIRVRKQLVSLAR